MNKIIVKNMTKKKAVADKAVKFNTIDEYHACFPPATLKKLEALRSIIRKAAPQSEEVISYNMPAFRANGVLVYYAAYKEHIGFYPTADPIRVFKEDLLKYKTSKGTIQFPIGKNIPASLVKKIVMFRVSEDLQKAKSKKSKAKPFVKYHNDGTLWAKGQMLNGKMHGYWKWFRKDGVIMRSGYFNLGKQTGEWTTYDKEGQVYKVTRMKTV
jgi:uncharacterized protein YdhG (YjbR/CyaY superfamily)